MKKDGLVYEQVSIEDMQRAVAEAGHSAEIRMNDSGRRTLHCETDGTVYAVQFYPNEGHATNAFGAIRFVAWFSDENANAETANAYNARFRFAAVFAADDYYELQHDIVAIGASDRNLMVCAQQWATSLDDFQQFLSDEA